MFHRCEVTRDLRRVPSLLFTFQVMKFGVFEGYSLTAFIDADQTGSSSAVLKWLLLIRQCYMTLSYCVREMPDEIEILVPLSRS